MKKQLKFYRKDGSLEQVKEYDEDGYIVQIEGYRVDGTKEFWETFDIGGDLQNKIFYRVDGSISQINSYRNYMNLGLEKIKNKKHLEKIKELALWVKRKYNYDGVLEQIVHYEEDGSIEQIKNFKFEENNSKLN